VSTYLNKQGDAPKLIEYYERSELARENQAELDQLVRDADRDLTPEVRPGRALFYAFHLLLSLTSVKTT
jgi:hypothetical protein